MRALGDANQRQPSRVRRPWIPIGGSRPVERSTHNAVADRVFDRIVGLGIFSEAAGHGLLHRGVGIRRVPMRSEIIAKEQCVTIVEALDYAYMKIGGAAPR